MRLPYLLVAALLGRLAVALPAPLPDSLDSSLEDRGAQCDNGCRRDSCLQALVNHNGRGHGQAYSDCASYQRTTVTPAPKTKTYTAMATITQAATTVTVTSTNVHTNTLTTVLTVTETLDSYVTEVDTVTTVDVTTFVTAVASPVTPGPTKRAVSTPRPLPAYVQGKCGKTAQYTSACACIWAPQQTITAPRPTITVTATQTRTAPGVTFTVTASTDATVTAIVTNTATATAMQTLTSTVEATATSVVTTAPQGPLFVLVNENDQSQKVSVEAGIGQFNLLLDDTHEATEFFMDENGDLYSIADDGEPVGYCANSAPVVDVFTYNPTTVAPCGGIAATPFQCQVIHSETNSTNTTHFGGSNTTNSTNSTNSTLGDESTLSCTVPGYQLSVCDGRIVLSTGSDAAPPAGCTVFETITLKYVISSTGPIQHTRDVGGEYAPRHRRKFRPNPKESMVQERESVME